MSEVINEKKNLCNLTGCQLLPEHPIDMGGMDMDMGMPEIVHVIVNKVTKV